MQKTNAAYLELHIYNSRLKTAKSFVQNDPGDCCCCAPSLDATSFESGYSTTEELVCSSIREEGAYYSCATCISHTVSDGTTLGTGHSSGKVAFAKAGVLFGRLSDATAICVRACFQRNPEE
jgi:hypothetical protein